MLKDLYIELQRVAVAAAAPDRLRQQGPLDGVPHALSLGYFSR